MRTGSDWVWFARGVETDHEDERGDYVNNGTVEIQQRAQYAAWLRLMSAEGVTPMAGRTSLRRPRSATCVRSRTF